MAGKRTHGNPVAVSDLTAQLLDPVLRRRTGMSVALIQSWEEIAGPRLAATSRPLKIQWPRRMSDDDPFEPATLVVACEGMAALRLQHETVEVIARVNAFLGFAAVGRIRIVQKPVTDGQRAPRATPRPLTSSEATRLDETVREIEHEGLKESLRRLGATVLTAKGARR